MQLVNYKIEPQNYELILERVGQILTLEFENQFIQFYNSICSDVAVYIEHFDPTNFTEMSIVSLSIDKGTYDNRHAGYVRGTYIYNIDLYTNSKSIGDDRGDKLSAVINHRIAGIIRAILENPIYKTLGFEPGSVGNLRVNSIEWGKIMKSNQDARNIYMSRIQLEFQAQETTPLLTGVPLLSMITKIKLENSDNGLQFIIQS
jgi:hypothetical protein